MRPSSYRTRSHYASSSTDVVLTVRGACVLSQASPSEPLGFNVDFVCCRAPLALACARHILSMLNVEVGGVFWWDRLSQAAASRADWVVQNTFHQPYLAIVFHNFHGLCVHVFSFVRCGSVALRYPAPAACTRVSWQRRFARILVSDRWAKCVTRVPCQHNACFTHV